MRAYNVEIFDSAMAYKDHTLVGECKYKYDYLDPEKNIIDVLKTVNVEKNDYIRITRGTSKYFGIVTKVVEKSEGLNTITYQDFSTLFDVDVFVELSEIGAGTLEDFIADNISECFITAMDTEQIIAGLSVTAETSTPTWTLDTGADADDTYAILNLFDDIIVPAFEKYSIVVQIEANVQAGTIELTITKNTAATATIEADLNNIVSKEITIKSVKKEVNKLVIYNKDDTTESVTYYLHNDGTYDTTDNDRVTPVRYSIVTVSVSADSTFAETAADKASNTFGRNRYENLIKLEMLNDDSLILPQDLQIGQVVSVISNGTSYSSVLTGKEIKDTTTLIFGTIRLELTKILKGRS